MGRSCPVELKSTDATTARLTALLVAIVTAVFLAVGHPLLVLALVPDFLARAAGRPALSPLARIAGVLRRLLRLDPHPTDGAPKRFAAGVGVGFAATAGLLALVSAGATAALAIAAILLVCALLEALLGYCVGCQVYALLPRQVRTLRRA